MGEEATVECRGRQQTRKRISTAEWAVMLVGVERRAERDDEEGSDNAVRCIERMVANCGVTRAFETSAGCRCERVSSVTPVEDVRTGSSTTNQWMCLLARRIDPAVDERGSVITVSGSRDALCERGSTGQSTGGSR